MKLMNKKNNTAYVEFTDEGKIIFYNDVIYNGFKTSGIMIPPSLREHYDNLTIIPLEHPKFKEAFVNVYYPLSMNTEKYQWEL